MKKSKNIKYKKLECPICLQIIKYKIETNCNHHFCDICIMKHLVMKNTCPMCRTECDYEYVTNQIKVKRQKHIMKKLSAMVILNAPVTGEQMNRMAHYSPMPEQIYASVFIICIFILKVYIVIYLVSFISEKVLDQYSSNLFV